MKLTLDLLQLIGACEEGTNFAVRNGLIGIDVSRLIAIGEDKHDFIDWIICDLLDTDVVVDDKDRVIRMIKDSREEYIIREFDDQDRLVLYKCCGDSKEYSYDGDKVITKVTRTHTPKKLDIVESVTQNGILISSISYILTLYGKNKNGGDKSVYHEITSEIVDGLLVVSEYDYNGSGKKIPNRKFVYKDNVIISESGAHYVAEYVNGLLTRRLSKHESGDKVTYTRKYNESNLPTEILYDHRSSHIEYDDRNNVTKQTYRTLAGTSVYEFKYDEHNNAIFNSYTENDKLISSYQTSYEFKDGMLVGMVIRCLTDGTSIKRIKLL